VRRGLNKPESQYNPHQLPTWFLDEMAVHLDKPLEIDHATLGAGAVTADWHHPLTNYELVNRFLDRALDLGATNWLLVGGDWFNQDFWSQWDNKQEEANVPRELRASSETMRRVLDVFDRVYMTWGNHDARLHKALKYAVQFKDTMRWLFSDLGDELIARMEFTNLDHAIIRTADNGDFRVAHPQAYNTKPLTTAIELAAKELTHVITAHSHHTAIGFDRSGEFTVAEIGGFFDRTKTKYLQRTTKYPKWTNGWGFIDSDGLLVVESPKWSNGAGRRA
jgi:hypothetical protein